MAWILWTLPVFKFKKKEKRGFLGVYFWRFVFQKTEEKKENLMVFKKIW